MQGVRTVCSALTGSPALCKCLLAIGEAKRIPPHVYLFKVEDSNNGVFLVRTGKVALLVEELPLLDRVFLAGSVLGLPSAFTENAYSLKAVTLVDSEIVHVRREHFLELMNQDATLCCEAIEMLGRELSFIQRALAQRGDRELPYQKPGRESKITLNFCQQGSKRFVRHTRIIVTHYGGPDALQVVEEDCHEPKDREVRVRVLAAGVSLPDIMAREGVHPETPRGQGCEANG